MSDADAVLALHNEVAALTQRVKELEDAAANLPASDPVLGIAIGALAARVRELETAAAKLQERLRTYSVEDSETLEHRHEPE